MHIFRRHLPWADNDSFADVLLAYPEIFLVHGPRGRRMARLRPLNDHYSRCDRETTCTCAYNICWQLHNSDETGSEEGEKGERNETPETEDDDAAEEDQDEDDSSAPWWTWADSGHGCDAEAVVERLAWR